MKNLLNYVAAGAEGFWDKEEQDWYFDFQKMPVDYYLINASTFMGSKEVERMEMQYQFLKKAGKHMFCDSGGFQLATEVIDSIDPVSVIEVQNRVCDMGFILYVPTMKRARGAGAGGLELDASPEYFEECLKATQKNIKKAKGTKRNFLYYAIIQGVSVEQLKDWWWRIGDLDTFAGVGTKGIIHSQVLNGLFFSEEMKIQRHHILGLGAAPRLLLVRYFYLLSKRDKVVVTYDNTNHIQYAKSMQIIQPFMNCCYNKSNDADLFEKETGIGLGMKGKSEILFATVRNLYYCGLQNKLLNMLDTPETVRDFIKSNFPKMLEFVHVIDDYFEKGPDYVKKVYADLVEPQMEKRKSVSMADLLRGK